MCTEKQVLSIIWSIIGNSIQNLKELIKSFIMINLFKINGTNSYNKDLRHVAITAFQVIMSMQVIFINGLHHLLIIVMNSLSIAKNQEFLCLLVNQWISITLQILTIKISHFVLITIWIFGVSKMIQRIGPEKNWTIWVFSLEYFQ